MGFGKKKKEKEVVVVTPHDLLFKGIEEGENAEKIEELASAEGVEIIAPNEEGDTVLTLAALKGDAEVAKVLVAKGADVGGIDNDGNTALHIAAYNGFLSMVEALVELGADKTVTNGSGQTPLELARMGEHEDVILFLDPPPKKKETKKERKAREKAEAEAKKKKEEEEKQRLLEESQAAEAAAAKSVTEEQLKDPVTPKSKAGDVELDITPPHSPAKSVKSVKSTVHGTTPADNSPLPSFPSALAPQQTGAIPRYGSMQSVTGAPGAVTGAPRKRGAKYEEMTRMTTQAAGKIVAANISKGMNLMQIHVYGIGFIRSVRETLYWLSMGDLLVTIVAFTLVYTAFLTSSAYNMIWLHLLHWPRAILGLLLIDKIPKYEKLSGNILSAMGEGNTDPEEAVQKLKTYLKRKAKKAKKFLIPYILCGVVTFFLDLLVLIILLWGTFDRTDAWTFATLLSLVYICLDVYLFLWYPTVKYGLPEALYKKLAAEIPSISALVTEQANAIKSRMSVSARKSDAEPGADLEEMIAMEEGQGEE